MNVTTLFKKVFFFYLNEMELKWTWFCWPCSWIIDATCVGRLVRWSFVILNFTYPSLCMYLHRQRKKDPNSCFLSLKGFQDCVSVPELSFKYVYPLLVFCIKKIRKRTLYCWACWHCPLYFFLFLGHMKQVILFLYLFFFCKLFLFCLKMAL